MPQTGTASLTFQELKPLRGHASADHSLAKLDVFVAKLARGKLAAR